MLKFTRELDFGFAAKFPNEELSKSVLSNFCAANQTSSTSEYLARIVQRNVTNDVFSRKLCRSFDVEASMSKLDSTTVAFSYRLILDIDLATLPFIAFWMPTFRVSRSFFAKRYSETVIAEMDAPFTRAYSQSGGGFAC